MSKNPRITSEEVGIIKRAQAGDMSAFNTLFYRYKPFVERILVSYLKDDNEAEYVSTDVFMKVYEKLSLFKDYSSFGGWLRIMTNRTAIDYLRQNKDKPALRGDSYDLTLLERPQNDVENDLVNHMTYKEIMKVIDALPKNLRVVHRLFYVDNLTVEAISEKLRIPTGTIKSMLSRTRTKIKKQILKNDCTLVLDRNSTNYSHCSI